MSADPPVPAALDALLREWRRTEEPNTLSEMGLRAQRQRHQDADELEAALHAAGPRRTTDEV